MNPFENLNEILFGSQRPWLPENSIETKYQSLYFELSEIQSSQNLKFEFIFFRPLNYKTQFYQRLIHNQKVQILDELIPLITNESDDNVVKYYNSSLLAKKLQTLVTDIGKVLKDKNYDLSYIDPKKNTFHLDLNHKSNTYIIQFLKVTAIHIYLELQSLFQIPKCDEFIEEDFYTRILFEPIPDSLFLNRITKIQLADELREGVNIKEQKVPTVPKLVSLFSPIKGEISNMRSSKVDYGIIKNEDKFAEIEAKLYDYKIIDIDYYFIKNKATSNSILLAGTIQVLIEKNYFRNRYAGFKGVVKNNDIREYFEKRYKTDIKQQFRKLTEAQKELALRRLPWLDNLPVLR